MNKSEALAVASSAGHPMGWEPFQAAFWIAQFPKEVSFLLTRTSRPRAAQRRRSFPKVTGLCLHSPPKHPLTSPLLLMRNEGCSGWEGWRAENWTSSFLLTFHGRCPSSISEPALTAVAHIEPCPSREVLGHVLASSLKTTVLPFAPWRLQYPQGQQRPCP